jgi:hypothetical protein
MSRCPETGTTFEPEIRVLGHYAVKYCLPEETVLISEYVVSQALGIL